MKFKSFYSGEVDIEVSKKRDTTAPHDHLIISINGEEVGYFHILGDALHFFEPDDSNPTNKVELVDLRPK